MKKHKVLKLLTGFGLILLVASLSVACAAPAPAPTPVPAPEPTPEPIVWRYNSNYVAEDVTGKTATYFCDSIEKRSGGLIIVEPYFASSLGFKGTRGPSLLKEGLVEMNEVGTSSAGEEAILSVSELPFVFIGERDSDYYIVEQYIPVVNEVFERKGWNSTICFTAFTQPIYFFSKKPLRTFDDWQGLKVRTWGGAVADALKIIGTDPFVIDVAELYTALQRGMVDAAITSYVSATSAHFWEVLDYIDQLTLTRGVDFVAVSNDAVNSLPEDLQKVFWDCAYDARNFNIVANILSYGVLEKTLVDGGMEVVLPSGDVAERMKQKLIEAGFYITLAEEAGPEATQLMKDIGVIK